MSRITIWWVDSEEQMFQVMDLRQEFQYNAEIGRFDECDRILDALQSMPGCPHNLPPGSRVEMRVRRKVHSVPSIVPIVKAN